MDTYQQVTVIPIRRTENASPRYRMILEDEPPPQNLSPDAVLLNAWTMPRSYNTPEDVVASLGSLLRIEYRLGILQALRDGKKVRFSLKDALSL
jgi:hypothetical protein